MNDALHKLKFLFLHILRKSLLTMILYYEKLLAILQSAFLHTSHTRTFTVQDIHCTYVIMLMNSNIKKHQDPETYVCLQQNKQL